MQFDKYITNINYGFKNSTIIQYKKLNQSFIFIKF